MKTTSHRIIIGDGREAWVMMLSPVCWMLCFPVLSIATAGWNAPTFLCAKVNEIGDMKLVKIFELKRR